jgi:hypothetical protein
LLAAAPSQEKVMFPEYAMIFSGTKAERIATIFGI